MAWTRPTLSTLINRIQADMDAKLAGDTSLLRRSNIKVIATVVAGVAHGLYGFLAWIAEQIMYDTAEGSILHRWASIFLTVPVKPAEYAAGPVVFTGTNGTLIPQDTVLIRADGIEYSTDADATIVAGTITANIVAAVAGANGSADAGTPLSLAQPIAGINGVVLVDAAGLTNGSDVETDESIRARLRSRLQDPAHGGSKTDYETWALEVPGVTRAWAYPLEQGNGTIVIRFVRDNDASIIPDAGEVTAVQEHIDELRTVTAKGCYVVAPIASALNFNIALTPNTVEVQAAVEAEIIDLLSRESVPGGTILLSHIREAISIAAGEDNYVMTAPVADVVAATGYMTTMGAVTWS